MCPQCRSSILDGRGLKYELNYAVLFTSVPVDDYYFNFQLIPVSDETDEICLLIYTKGLGYFSAFASDVSSAIDLAPFAHLFVYYFPF